MFARFKKSKSVFLFLTPRAWTEYFPQWQGSLSVVCRRFIYAQAQCFFVSCCLRGSANGMYVKTRLQKADPQFIYAQAQCFFIPRLSSMACLTTCHAKRCFFSPFRVTIVEQRHGTCTLLTRIASLAVVLVTLKHSMNCLSVQFNVCTSVFARCSGSSYFMFECGR